MKSDSVMRILQVFLGTSLEDTPFLGARVKVHGWSFNGSFKVARANLYWVL